MIASRSWVVLFTILVFAQAPAADDTQAGELKGTWRCVSATINGNPLTEKVVAALRLTLTGERYKTEKKFEVLFDSTYTVDASKEPKQIDMVGTEGELTGKKVQGIYLLRGDVLQICYTMPGKPRPDKFESSPGSDAYLIVWKREQT